MLAKHRTARWAKIAAWVIMPLLLVPMGGLAMYWAANLGLVPGLTPPITVIRPADMLDNVLELRHLATSAGARLRSFQADVLTQLRRRETSKPAVFDTPSLAASPAASLLSEVKITPASPKVSSAKSSTAAPATKNEKSDKEQKETPAKSAPPKAKLADTKTTPALPQSTQTARSAAVASSAPSVVTATAATDIKAETRPAAPNSGKTPAASPATARLLAAPVQAKFPGMLAATTSCRAGLHPEKRQAPTEAAQSPDRQTDRASGATLASLMSRAVNPLATGTALAKSEATATNATQTTPGGKTSPQSAQTQEQEPFPASFPQGSLGQMVKLRAELEQLKLQVHIEEVRQRLNQLKGQPSPTNPAPSLEFPPIGLPGPSTAPADEAPRKTLRLLSIQSLNGKYTATIGTDSGPRVVRANETIDGYRVVSISRNSVVINRGKGNEMLSIYE